MRPTRQLLSLLLLLQCIFLLSIQTAAVDKLEIGQNLTDGQTLISAGGSFTLGFFSPGVSTNRYLGIWFAESNDTVYWVANRDSPLRGRSGTLVFNDAGSLVLLDGSRRIAWSSDFPGTTTAAAAQLLESGNLVVRNGSRDAFLWQSFDHPSDTLLPGMKLGKSLWSGAKWQLTSWRSADNPSLGDYRRTLEGSRLPELVLWHRGVKTYRTGPWNGRVFNGVPEATTYSHEYQLNVSISATEITYGYTALPGARLTRVVVNHTGVVERLVLDSTNGEWISFFKGPKGDNCDAYASCGAFGLCNSAAASVCGCVPGFSPASPSAWQLKRYAGGCRRDMVPDCDGGTSTDRFKVVTGVKLPDTKNASVETGVTLEECKARCYANCSCLAYAAAHIQERGDGTGCIIWADTIVDLRLVDIGQNLYLRLSKSEFGDDPNGGKKNPVLPIVVPVVCGVTVLLGIFLIRWKIRRRIIDNEVQHLIVVCRDQGAIPQNPAMAVHPANLSTMKHVTRNFSRSNFIGRGRFGVVYEAELAEGMMVVVKRLKQSALTIKDKEYFAREVEAMAGLRHASLVRLLAYCNQCKERILVYEFVENLSLGDHIFGTTRTNAPLLGWERRLEIIEGIADSVSCLQGRSGHVIHGDLKPGNILFDNEWNVKIADFGLAKRFAVDQTGSTIVVSPGYAAPELHRGQMMTLECDVYSLGVIMLETLSGQMNGVTNSLLLRVVGLYMGNGVMELLHENVELPFPDHESGHESERELFFKMKQCIEIALHCVQQEPDERPTMSAIVAMLRNTTSPIGLLRHSTLDSMVTAWSRDREPAPLRPI